MNCGRAVAPPASAPESRISEPEPTEPLEPPSVTCADQSKPVPVAVVSEGTARLLRLADADASPPQAQPHALLRRGSFWSASRNCPGSPAASSRKSILRFRPRHLLDEVRLESGCCPLQALLSSQSLLPERGSSSHTEDNRSHPLQPRKVAAQGLLRSNRLLPCNPL
jgi:hypothetical protein